MPHVFVWSGITYMRDAARLHMERSTKTVRVWIEEDVSYARRGWDIIVDGECYRHGVCALCVCVSRMCFLKYMCMLGRPFRVIILRVRACMPYIYTHYACATVLHIHTPYHTSRVFLLALSAGAQAMVRAVRRFVLLVQCVYCAHHAKTRCAFRRDGAAHAFKTPCIRECGA